jgi:hypothetical protein
MRLGLKGLTTPPWAQDIGTRPDPEQVLHILEAADCPLTVLDLPPGMASPLAASHSAWTLERHTRQLFLNPDRDPVDDWPSTRRKQFRRAEREGMSASATGDLDLMVALHQASRQRKGLSSDGGALKRLLVELLAEPDTHAWVVRDDAGAPIAGGVFHGAGDARCIYGFGGQFRSGKRGRSSRASVLLIGTAMRHAAARGAKTFDFGGSHDQGVDRFYAEFGAERIPKVRLVRIRGWWRPILRWRRPDLFPR